MVRCAPSAPSLFPAAVTLREPGLRRLYASSSAGWPSPPGRAARRVVGGRDGPAVRSFVRCSPLLSAASAWLCARTRLAGVIGTLVAHTLVIPVSTTRASALSSFPSWVVSCHSYASCATPWSAHQVARTAFHVVFSLYLTRTFVRTWVSVLSPRGSSALYAITITCRRSCGSAGRAPLPLVLSPRLLL